MTTYETKARIQARDVMVIAPIIGFWASLRAAARGLEHSQSDALLVQHDDGRLVGILTERDVIFAAQAEAEGHPSWAGEYANQRFVRATEDEHLDAVLRRMVERQVRRAVVFEGDAPVGMISVRLSIPANSREPSRHDVHAAPLYEALEGAGA